MNPEIAQKIGQIIRRRRTELGLSTTAVGAMAGVEQSTIVRIELGAFASPRADTLAKIAQALKLPLDTVFSEAGWTEPSQLPDFRPYLRRKYADLPDEDLERIERYAERLAKKHGINLKGPVDGEDEEPETN
jgi:transcriptional regulator with XRE-family HTH domain